RQHEHHRGLPEADRAEPESRMNGAQAGASSASCLKGGDTRAGGHGIDELESLLFDPSGKKRFPLSTVKPTWINVNPLTRHLATAFWFIRTFDTAGEFRIGLGGHPTAARTRTSGSSCEPGWPRPACSHPTPTNSPAVSKVRKSQDVVARRGRGHGVVPHPSQRGTAACPIGRPLLGLADP